MFLVLLTAVSKVICSWVFKRFFKKEYKYFSSLRKRKFAAVTTCENVRLTQKTGSTADARTYVKRFRHLRLGNNVAIDARLSQFGNTLRKMLNSDCTLSYSRWALLFVDVFPIFDCRCLGQALTMK